MLLLSAYHIHNLLEHRIPVVILLQRGEEFIILVTNIAEGVLECHAITLQVPALGSQELRLGCLHPLLAHGLKDILVLRGIGLLKLLDKAIGIQFDRRILVLYARQDAHPLLAALVDRSIEEGMQDLHLLALLALERHIRWQHGSEKAEQGALEALTPCDTLLGLRKVVGISQRLMQVVQQWVLGAFGWWRRRWQGLIDIAVE